MTMTTAQITEAQAKAAIKYEIAKQIRNMLDTAKKTYGATAWDADDVETEIIDLVTG